MENTDVDGSDALPRKDAEMGKALMTCAFG